MFDPRYVRLWPHVLRLELCGFASGCHAAHVRLWPRVLCADFHELASGHVRVVFEVSCL